MQTIALNRFLHIFTIRKLDPMIDLYNAPQSTCSQRVRFGLHEKGLPFAEHKLDLFTGDQLKPAYLKINPNGVVPSLLHDKTAITDSPVIMEYIDEIWPKPRLSPESAAAKAQMRSMMRFIDEVLTPAIRIPSYNLAFLPHYQAMTDKEFQDLCDSKPLRREFLMKMGRSGFSKRDMGEALSRLQRGLERMADWLSASAGVWLLGKSITLADISIMPVIVRMDDMIRKGVRPDGTKMLPPMPYVYLEKMSDNDVAALVLYLRSLRPRDLTPRLLLPWKSNILVN